MVNMEIGNVHTSVLPTKRKHTTRTEKIVKTAGTSPPREPGTMDINNRQAHGSNPQLLSGSTLRKIKAQPLADSSLTPASLSRPTSQPCPHSGQRTLHAIAQVEPGCSLPHHHHSKSAPSRASSSHYITQKNFHRW